MARIKKIMTEERVAALKERKKEVNRAYRNKNREKLKERKRIWRINNLDAIKARAKHWKSKAPEYRRAMRLAHSPVAKPKKEPKPKKQLWAEAYLRNRDKKLAYLREYRLKNKGKIRQLNKRRKVRLKGATVGNIDLIAAWKARGVATEWREARISPDLEESAAREKAMREPRENK